MNFHISPKFISKMIQLFGFAKRFKHIQLKELLRKFCKIPMINAFCKTYGKRNLHSFFLNNQKGHFFEKTNLLAKSIKKFLFEIVRVHLAFLIC